MILTFHHDWARIISELIDVKEEITSFKNIRNVIVLLVDADVKSFRMAGCRTELITYHITSMSPHNCLPPSKSTTTKKTATHILRARRSLYDSYSIALSIGDEQVDKPLLKFDGL